MKKNLLLALFLVAFGSFSWGQIHILRPSNKNVLNDSTIYVYCNTNISYVSFDLYATNSGPKITVVVKRDSILLPMKDTDNAFCWGGLCFAKTVDTATLTESLGTGDTAKGANAFSGHYYPYGHVGIATIRYVFYNKINPLDSAWVLVNYDAIPGLGVQNIADKAISFSTPYPNPASNSVTFNYNLSNSVQAANLKIFNLLGECIQTLPLNASKNKASVNIQSIPSGVYVCEIQASGCQPAYQKLVVSH